MLTAWYAGRAGNRRQEAALNEQESAEVIVRR